MSIDHVTGSGGQGPRAAAPAREGAQNPLSGQAWQREMERAQMAGWFQPPLPATASSDVQAHPSETESALEPTSAASPAARPDRGADPFHPGPAQAPALVMGAAYGLPSMPLCAPAPASPSGASSLIALRSVVTTAAQQHIAREALAPATKHPASGATEPPQPADIRVHIEAAAQGAAVWIGLPAQDAEPTARLDALLQTLRQRLRQEGSALQSLTVNGRTVWSAPLNPPIPGTPEEA